MLKAMIQSSPFYPAVRSTYRAVFKPEQVAAAARMGAFLAQFFQPGEVVFGVGANQGEYAECFAREGGRVIAIEPNAAHRTRLEALAKFLPITPAYMAISDHPGVATLNICSTSGYSTLADTNSAWMAESPDYATVDWIGSAEVLMVTLDDVAAQYGQPSCPRLDARRRKLRRGSAPVPLPKPKPPRCWDFNTILTAGGRFPSRFFTSFCRIMSPKIAVWSATTPSTSAPSVSS
jgi:FkbM family methyltransferase